MNTTLQALRRGFGLLVVSAVLAACGGGGGGGGGGGNDDSSDSSDGSDTTSLSGNVELVNGTAEADTRPWAERMLAFVLADTHADIGGLIDAPDGTTVRLIRIGSDGNEVDQVATTETEDGRFSFEIELDSEAGGDLIIEAGPASDPVRAPAGGEDLMVNPVSTNIVSKVIARVQAGGAFSDFRASDLASLVRIVIDELDTKGTTFSGTTNASAADEADTEAGDTDDDLVESVEGENDVATAFIGDKNLAAIDVLVEAFGDNAGFAVLNNSLAPTISDDLRLDASGTTIEDARTERSWTFADGGGVTSSGAQSTTTETGTSDDAFDITVGNDGRLFALGGNIRGAVSDDGTLFTMTETRTEQGGDGAAFGLFAGGSTWSPGDVDETFNFVKLTGYVEAGGSKVGYLTTHRGDADLTCTDGNCSVDLNRFAADGDMRKFYAQIAPDGTLETDSTADLNFGGFELDETLSLEDFSLDSTGRFGGSAEEVSPGIDYRTRGFVGPDASMMVLQVSSEDVGVRADELFVGLPQGTSCDAADLDGDYNMVWLTGVLGSGGPTVAVESETLLARADSQGNAADDQGSLDINASRYREAVITFDGTNTGLSRDVIADTDDTGIPYTVTSDCKVSISDTADNVVQGAVSPDGQAFVLATYSVESSGAETFQSLAIGLRRPAP